MRATDPNLPCGPLLRWVEGAIGERHSGAGPRRAAEAAGQSLTDFMLSHLRRAAREVELEMRVVLLSAADSSRVAEAIIDPPEPVAAAPPQLLSTRRLAPARGQSAASPI